jgi:hypothetical protein
MRHERRKEIKTVNCWNCDEELKDGICPNGCMHEEDDEEIEKC